MKSHFLSLAISALLAAGSAGADTIDFTQLAGGDLGPGPITVDGVTFKPDHNMFNYSEYIFPDSGGSVCSLDPVAYNCQNDMSVSFNGKVKRLSLASGAYDAGDSLTISVYRGKKLLGSTAVTSDGPINLRSFGRVTKLVFDDNSSGAGYAFGNFKFKRLTATTRHEQDGKKRHSAKARNAAAAN
jgi:hypothetical protein